MKHEYTPEYQIGYNDGLAEGQDERDRLREALEDIFWKAATLEECKTRAREALR